jgi:hypothetical protein
MTTREQYRLANRLWRLIYTQKIDEQTYTQLMGCLDADTRTRAIVPNGPAAMTGWHNRNRWGRWVGLKSARYSPFNRRGVA